MKLILKEGSTHYARLMASPLLAHAESILVMIKHQSYFWLTVIKDGL